jgi:ribosomal protein S18 acetylase RimI-like enzyme
MTETTVSIRAATPDDAASIAIVHVRSWQVAYRGQLPDELLDNLSVEQRTRWWAEGFWSKDIAHRRLLVAEADGSIRGFAVVGPRRDESATDATGELYAIYVDPDVWTQGIGRHLMERAVDELRSAGFAEATLWVLETNERARRFYEIAGWQTDGARRVERLREGGVEAVEVRYRRDL